MSLRARLPIAVSCTLMAWPISALAEVMDKEAVPWSPSRVVATAVVIALCALLMYRASGSQTNFKWAAAMLAAGIAVLWAAAAAFDDFFSSDVGPAMRVELGSHASAYAALLLIEAVAPIVIVAGSGLRMLKTPSQREAQPR